MSFVTSEQDATSAQEVKDTTDATSLSKFQVDLQGPQDQVRINHLHSLSL